MTSQTELLSQNFNTFLELKKIKFQSYQLAKIKNIKISELQNWNEKVKQTFQVTSIIGNNILNKCF